MKIGDKVLAEGVISAIGEGFYRVQFGRVGTQAVTHVRIAADQVEAVKPKAPKKALVAGG
jgi:hypothetical protein